MAKSCVDVDLADPPRAIDVPPRYPSALVLLRWRGRPLGQLELPVTDGRIEAIDLWLAAGSAVGDRLAAAAVETLLCPLPDIGGRCAAPPISCSVIVCTRNRARELRRCLDSICRSGTAAEIIVVDNAPLDDATARVAASYPVQYVVEHRPGLNWARSRGARVATSDVVIYTDDDVVVDRAWVDAMRSPFADAAVGAVTGLVLPLELETPAQEAFERFVGFGRGFERRSFSANTLRPVGCARVGAGASMAIRRELVTGMRLFDVELDGGTLTRSGGDHYAFYRLLRSGHVIVYNPEALSWHRHRRSDHELRSTLFGYSVGAYCYLLRCMVAHGDLQAFFAGMGWFLKHHVRQLWRGLRHHPDAQPPSLTLAEWRGALTAPWAFARSLRRRQGHPDPCEAASLVGEVT
jgi:glycosyltransferase involved in cell wall biosynthesis